MPDFISPGVFAEAGWAEFAIPGDVVRRVRKRVLRGSRIELSGGLASFPVFAEYLQKEHKLPLLRRPHPEYAVLQCVRKEV